MISVKFMASNSVIDREVYSLPTALGRDIVTEIEGKRMRTEMKKRNEKCLGTISCDCKRCRGFV